MNNITLDKVKAPLIPAVIGIFIALSILWLVGNMESLGRNIPAADIYSDYMVGVLWAVIMMVVLFVLPLKERNPLLKVWGIKVFVVLIFMLFYEQHYGVLDTYGYFERALNKEFSLIPQISKGTENIIRLNMLLIPLTGKSFHALKVVYSFLGLMGMYLFYKAAIRYTGKPDRRLLYFLTLFPSILFWSSILGKDPIVLLILGFYAYNIVAWIQEKKNSYLVAALLCLGISVFVRGWLAFVGGVPIVLMALLKIRHPLRRAISLTISIGFSIWAGMWFQDYFHLENTRDIIDMTERVSRSWAFGGSAQQTSSFKSIGDMIIFLPLGAFTALFRPLPWEAHNFFAFLSSMENAALIIITVLAIKRFRIGFLKDPVVLWAILLVSVWTGMYAFVSYHNLGTAVRYKLQILPVFLLLLFLMGWKEGRNFLNERLKNLPGVRK